MKTWFFVLRRGPTLIEVGSTAFTEREALQLAQGFSKATELVGVFGGQPALGPPRALVYDTGYYR